MLTSTQRPMSYRPTAVRTLFDRVRAIVAWPFTNYLASPIWLVVRLYLAYLWFNFGISKLQSGWLTSDPVGAMLQGVANGTIKVPFEFYRGVAQMLISTGATTILSHTMPFLELAVALSFATGVLVVPAAIGATLLNVNFILSGIAQINLDGKFIVLQLLLVMAYRIVGMIGFQRLVVRILSTIVRTIRPARRSATTLAQ